MHRSTFPRSGGFALFALAVAACGGSSSSAPSTTQLGAPPPSASTAVAGDPSCPVEVPGTSVTVEDAERGVALVFVTTGDVAAVRLRVAEMGRMHNDHHGKMGPLPTGDETAPAGHDHAAMANGGGHAGHGTGAPEAKGPHAGHDMSGAGAATGHEGHAGGMIGVHARATVEEIPEGARLVLVSTPGDLAKLRDELEMHARHLASGSCSMGHGG